MRGTQFEHYDEEQVTILTEGERIDGTLYYMGGARLSDFLNAPLQEEFRFVKIKNPTVRMRLTGEDLGNPPFVMVARERIVLVMAHHRDPSASNQDAPGATAAGLFRRDPFLTRPPL